MEGPNAPQVWLVNFGDSSVHFILAVWLTDEGARRNLGVRAAYLWELDTALKKYGIEIPFPQRDLNIRSLFGLEGEDALKVLRGAGEWLHPRRPHRHELSDEERAQLSRNDARMDAELGLVESDAESPENLDQYTEK